MPQPISVENFLKLPGHEVLRRYHFAQVGNVLMYSGAVTIAFTLLPSLQRLSLQIESLVGLNLWRLTKLPRWLATALLPTALLGAFAKAAFPAVTNPVSSEAARATSVSRVLATFMSAVGGWRVRTSAGGTAPPSLFTGSWQHLVVLHLSWLPSVSYYKWFSCMPQLRSFFYLTSPLDDITRQLSPQAVFVMDIGCCLAERAITLLRAHIVTRILGETVSGTWKMFARQFVCTLLACTTAFVISSWCPRIPLLRIPTFSGGTLTTICMERHMPMMQSMCQAVLEQCFDKLVSKWIPLFPYPPPAIEKLSIENLTPHEESLVRMVQDLYGLEPQHVEVVERLATDAFLNPTVDASRRVAFSTILWASSVIAQRHDALPKKNILLAYKDKLQRKNHEMEEDVLVRQETSNVMAQSGTFGADTDLCAVCLSKVRADQDLIEVAHCHHTFHTECITAWLSKGTQCPICRYDIAEDKEGMELEADQQAADNSVERRIAEGIDGLGFSVPHTYDYEEWGVVRKYCYEHNISSNAALSVFRDDSPVNPVTYYDLVVAPVLFMLDAYNMTMTFVRSDYIDYS